MVFQDQCSTTARRPRQLPPRRWPNARLLAALAGAIGLLAAATDTTEAQGTTGTQWRTEVAESAIADGARIEQAGGETRFILQMDRPVTVRTFTLASPYRVIVDMPNVVFHLPQDTGTTGGGLVTQFRYGLLAPGRSRVVLDTNGPVRVLATELQPGSGRQQLVVRLASVAAAQFTSEQPEPVGKALRPATFDQAPRPRGPETRPIVVLDPGHGGLDPGARRANASEKDVALAVAQRVAKRLEAAGSVIVKMTRTEDVFLSLDERVAFSEESGADLFVSLHADAIADPEAAQSIRGASIYMLSDEASDEQARRLAEKENAADLLAGVASSVGEPDTVRNILFDLMRRETANFSAAARQTLITGLRSATTLSRVPARSAAFRVLNQARTPAVLIELGYISNTEDQRSMFKAEWQDRVADAIALGIDRFFASTRR